MRVSLELRRWAITLALSFVTVGQAYAQAGVFEVIHPDVKRGQFEVEALNGIAVTDVDPDGERSVHEFALGLGITDYWKFTAAFELANPENGGGEVEALEFETVLLLPFVGQAFKGLLDVEAGFYAAVEIPREQGISEGELALGPVWETEIGPIEFVGNLFLTIPFADGGDLGLAYATQAVLPVSNGFGIGYESFGELPGLFGSGGDNEFVIGPALYYEAELSNGDVLEPRLALLFGLNDNSPDAVLSVNFEYKFGGK